MDWCDIFCKSFFYGPFVAFFLIVFIPAAFGRTIGFRRRYVQALIYLFEYGKRRIDKAYKLKSELNHGEDEDSSSGSDEQGDYQDEGPQATSTPKTGHNEVFGPGPTTGPSPGRDDVKSPTSPCPPTPPPPSVQQPRVLRRRTKSMAVQDSTPPSCIVRTTKRRLSLSDDLSESPVSRTFSNSGELIEEEPAADFLLSDIFEFVTSGIEAIVNDQVTQRFITEELKSWNLLTRTNRSYEFISFRLSILWLLGCILRYWILLPIRLVFFFVSMVTLVVTTFLIGLVPNSFQRKRELHDIVTRFSNRLFSRSFSLITTYHQTENKPKPGGICVANHTTVVDIVPLACETSFALIGQIHGGFLGFLQFVLRRASDHIFFERAEAKDRMAVTKRLRDHVGDGNKLPILIFPEGTCINNSAVMQFKKGSFEVGGLVYPVAIKYDPRFGDAFWNSSEQSMLQYLYMMMTSWAIVCDVWYLPPMQRLDGESAIDFANRVKAEIARQGGLVDLDWDGQLKRYPAKREWKEKEQLKYSKKLTSTSQLYSPKHEVIQS